MKIRGSLISFKVVQTYYSLLPSALPSKSCIKRSFWQKYKLTLGKVPPSLCSSALHDAGCTANDKHASVDVLWTMHNTCFVTVSALRGDDEKVAPPQKKIIFLTRTAESLSEDQNVVPYILSHRSTTLSQRHFENVHWSILLQLLSYSSLQTHMHDHSKAVCSSYTCFFPASCFHPVTIDLVASEDLTGLVNFALPQKHWGCTSITDSVLLKGTIQ